MANIKTSNFKPATRDLSETDILKHFTDKYREWNRQEPLLDFLERHLFFITIKFNLNDIPWWRSDPTAIMKEFSRLYYFTSKGLIGNNLNRKRELQPLTYAFMDFEGTRSKTHSADILRSDFPHIHVMALVRPEHVSKFAMAMRSKGLLNKSIKDCEIVAYNRYAQSVEDLISYCMKGWKKIPPNDRWKEDLWGFYPR